MKRHQRRLEILRFVLLGLGLVLVAIPFAWILLTAVKYPVDAASVPPKFLSAVTLDNFRALVGNGYIKSLLNSTIITCVTTASTLILGVPAGYSFRVAGSRAADSSGCSCYTAAWCPRPSSSSRCSSSSTAWTW